MTPTRPTADTRTRRLPLLTLCALGPLFVGTVGATARAQEQAPPEPAPVDVVVASPKPPRRIVAIEYNPVSLLIGRISANVEIVPAEHHGLVLTPFYFSTTTPEFTNDAGEAVLSQNFKGFGGEIGYRYYSGREGPRGWFIGPSLLVADVTATAGNGSQRTITDLGIAADIGYQALVADRWVVSLGGGGQYTFTSADLPHQQMPAAIYANSGLQPRVLFALGCAF